MVEETFVAKNPKEAFDLAKEKYGHFSDLKLLKATQIRGEDGKLVSKITVSVSENDFLNSIGTSEEAELISEMEQLKSQINEMKSAFGSQDQNLQNWLTEHGLSDKIASELSRSVDAAGIGDNPELVKSYIIEEIESRIKVESENHHKRKMVMLIGSTGVGKTTTIAKLTARYGLELDPGMSIALVNLDSFRVGAYEQLDHYAKQMYVEHIKVDSVDEFPDVLQRLERYDLVLIDTAGISPYDTGRLIKTIEFLKNKKEYLIEISLVIAATAKQEDIEDIYEHFSFLSVDNVILTKFDETKHIGEILSFVIENDLPISYISNGQNVPNDIEPATKSMLIDRFAGELNA